MTAAAKRPLLIGVDFDNTIVSYDRVFHDAAVDRGLISERCSARKEAIRDTLRGRGREDDWTCLQGWVYGPGMRLAEPFPGALGFFDRCHRESLRAVIISHRTRWPYKGRRYDLHAAARTWLKEHGLGVEVHLELTKQQKLARIATERCTHFIDDLLEFLTEPGFPDDVERVLFDPHSQRRAQRDPPPSLRRAESWAQITRLLVGG